MGAVSTSENRGQGLPQLGVPLVQSRKLRQKAHGTLVRGPQPQMETGS